MVRGIRKNNAYMAAATPCGAYEKQDPGVRVVPILQGVRLEDLGGIYLRIVGRWVDAANPPTPVFV